jgi:hypothetical protein
VSEKRTKEDKSIEEAEGQLGLGGGCVMEGRKSARQVSPSIYSMNQISEEYQTRFDDTQTPKLSTKNLYIDGSIGDSPLH